MQVARTSYFMRTKSYVFVPHGRMKWPPRTRGPISPVTVKHGQKQTPNQRLTSVRIKYGY